MNAPSPLPVAFALLLISVISGCEKPEQRQPPELEASSAPVPTAPVVPPQPVTPPSAENPPSEAPATEPTQPEPELPEAELPEAEPELSVALVGNQILLSGALRSRIQVDRIPADLARHFPDHELVNELKLEQHRIAVGWGNRVADEFLSFYLTAVKGARVTYRNGVLTLEGSVPSDREHRLLTEMAVDTFSGGNTERVENKIVVEEPKPAKP